MYYVKGKGVFENSGRKVGSKRKMDLALARIYGSQNNREQFTRLVKTNEMFLAYMAGYSFAKAVYQS